MKETFGGWQNAIGPLSESPVVLTPFGTDVLIVPALVDSISGVKRL